MKKIMVYIGMLWMWSWASSAAAVQLPPVLEWLADSTELQLPLKNDGTTAQEYVLKAVETGTPGQDAKVLDAVGSKLMFYPARLKLTPGQSGVFKLKYQGPRDELERYFQLAIEEQASAKAQVASGVSMSFPLLVKSNLVVRPQHPKLNFAVKNGYVHNTGNGYFLLMQDEDCGTRQGMTAFVMPGQRHLLPPKNGKSILYVGMVEDVKVVSSQCN